MGTSWYFSWKLNYFGIPKWKQGLFNIPQSGHESVYLLEPSFHSRTPNNSTFMKNISWCPCLKVRVNFIPRRNYAAHFTVKSKCGFFYTFFDRFLYRTNFKKLMSVLYFTVQWDCLHCASLCSVIASLCTEYRVSKWKRIPLLLDTLYFPWSFVIVITETVLPKHADGLIGGKFCYWTLNNEQ